MPRTNYKNVNFDIDLNWASIYEQEVVDMFEHNGAIEVKAERDQWHRTGNVAVELYRVYKDTKQKTYTGVMTTDAYWWHISLVLNNETKRCITIKSKDLKDLVIKFGHKKKYKVISMGDKDSKFTTYGMLVPLKELYNKDNIK
tara:strand:+ start:67 stop:495 length:429 start_codon:yes stop_codon:yes gene_type:complete